MDTKTNCSGQENLLDSQIGGGTEDTYPGFLNSLAPVLNRGGHTLEAASNGIRCVFEKLLGKRGNARAGSTPALSGNQEFLEEGNELQH